jgi:RNA polymerase sigma factor (sigma-70 family)
MQALDDSVLLRQYVENHSDEAFAALVTQHINLVYSVALRQVGDPNHAEEIAQAVFIILAKKAASLRHEKALSSWLFQTTRLTANNSIRSELRRQHREQEAFMQSEHHESVDAVWQQIGPVLDDAVAALGEKDRRAIVLRFYEGRSLRDVGDVLGVSEDASEKRVTRALDKLRQFFFKRGLPSASAAIAGSISANSVIVAPTGLAKTVSAVALSKSTVASTSTLTLAKGALKVMAWSKTKISIVGVAIALLGIGTPTIAIIAYSAGVRENSYFQADYRHFQRLPANLFILRPTHFHTPAHGLDYSCETDSPAGDHVTWNMGRNRSFAQLLARINNCATYQVVLPPGAPLERFDYLNTMRDTLPHLETAIRQLGYAAHWEDRNVPAFLLRVQMPYSPGLNPDGSPKKQSMRWISPNRLEFQNLSLVSLVNEIQDLANVPVMDETGRPDPYDYILNCSENDLSNRNWDSINTAVGQLGLELIPTNMPIRMLVVEKVN